MMAVPAFLIALLFVVNTRAEVYFEDRFIESNIDKWEKSKYDESNLGLCEYAKPKGDFDDKEDGGMRTTQDARFYRYSAPFNKPLSNKDKIMCVQFTVKHEQNIDCGGGYVKLLGESFKPDDFHGESPYEIMFGPDICGYDKKIVHVIFSYKGKNYLVKRDIPCKSDTLTHLYTLIVRPDNTFEVLIDNKTAETGSLVADFDMIPPRTIDDPDAKKPEDWVDEAEIPDPDDKKPDDWDQPKTIVDTNAKQPEDWNEETDGEWTAPMIDNPDYKGEWHPKMIPNPAYRGEWKPPQIPNPDHFEDSELYARTFAYIGLDLWQVKSGTIFDNFIVSDNVSECQAHAEYWQKRFAFEEEEEKKSFEEKDKESSTTDNVPDESEDEEVDLEEGGDASSKDEL
ncbi:Calreticulin [Taenia solium]|eukprot:TsM_000094800 transcript=TsM_000094800 gene=TsM_000094800